MAMFGGALMLILGALAVGSGYGWGTWKTVFTQGPKRTEVVGGTLVALAVTVAALVLAAFVIDVSVASVIALSESQSVDQPSISQSLNGIGSGIMILGMWTLGGVLIGAIARGPALAVGLGLVWVLVVENLLRGVAAILGPLQTVTDYLPGTAAGSLAGAMRTVQGEPVPGVLDILSRSESLVVLGIYLVAFAAGTILLIRRRDLI
jgi:ABC-type transport system involved in multi-copper enzyme maturation permease subunit